ncbi:MAG TPA: hypothetical protein VFD69_10360 [Vicinamibacterales bacterium]|nr:hypothetical protein [Vicinamibacterales bacterium]
MSARTAVLVAIALLAPWSAAAQSPPACDRACLTGILSGYVAGLAAKDPSKVSVADTVRITEDTKPIALGEGLWKTITALRPYRLDFIDVREGTAATFAVAEDAGKPALVAVRLKVVNRRITEIESMVVRSREEGVLFQPDNLQTPNAGMTYVPTPAERNPREDLVRIASLYPAGLRAGSFLNPDVPMSDDAYRFENGMKMAGPGCVFQPPSCQNMKAQKIPRLPGLTYRVVTVDEEMGTVVTFEAFKVYGGKIHAAEAILETLPIGAPSGWDK